MATIMKSQEGGRLSATDIKLLVKIKQGVAGAPPEPERSRFLRLGYVEQKFGGYVLTALGRYNLDIRARDTGLPLLARRWRQRARQMATVAEDMTNGEAEPLRALAGQWTELAELAERIERTERELPFLT